MRDTDNLLIGTSWTRTQGNHSPAIGTIDDINSQGPRLKLKDGSHRRLKWMELDIGWFPTDARSNKRYQVWRHAERINYLDEKDAELKQIVAAAQTPIESETTVSTEVNGGAVEIEATKECHGPWHRHGDSYEQVPLSKFSVATRGFNVGQLLSLCDDCRQRQRESDVKRKAVKQTGIQTIVLPPRKKPGPKPRRQLEIEPVKIVPPVVTPEGPVFRWKITITVSVEHLVQGKDFLEAAAQVSELGEITRVEKL